MELQEIMGELLKRTTANPADDPKIRNAQAELEAAYRENPQAVEALLADPRPAARLIINAWFAGREKELSEERKNKILNDIALLYCACSIKRGKSMERRINALDYFRHIPEIALVQDTIKSMPDNAFLPKEQEREFFDEIEMEVVRNTVALAYEQIPELYRIYRCLFLQIGDCRDDLYKAFRRCRDAAEWADRAAQPVIPEIEKIGADEIVKEFALSIGVGVKETSETDAFHNAYPHIGAEEDLLKFAHKYKGSIKFLDKILESNMELALDVMREISGIFYPDDDVFIVAWRVWEAGQGLDLVPLMTEYVRKIYKEEFKDKEAYANLEPWIFGEINLNVAEVVQEKLPSARVWGRMAYFWRVATFPARMIELGFYKGDYNILFYLPGVFDAHMVNDYLMANGVTKEFLIECYQSFADLRDLPGWEYLLE
jgi:hypothetical protein